MFGPESCVNSTRPLSHERKLRMTGNDILQIPRRTEVPNGAAMVGIKHGPDLLAVYSAGGRLMYIFDSVREVRSEEHTSELQSLMRISYAVFCLKKKNNKKHT